MKKTLFILLAATVAFLPVRAGQLPKVAVGAGWAANVKTNISRNSGNSTSETLNGFYLSGDCLFSDLMGPISLNPGLRVMMDFGRQERIPVSDKSVYTEQDVETYIQIPVDFRFGCDFNGIEPFVFAGPTFHFGISSRTIQSYNESYSSVQQNYIKDKEYSPFNILLGAGGGCRFKCIRVSVRYDYGLLNRWRGRKAESRSMNDSVFTVGAAYCF